jgi:hypothetical protein
MWQSISFSGRANKTRVCASKLKKGETGSSHLIICKVGGNNAVKKCHNGYEIDCVKLSESILNRYRKVREFCVGRFLLDS